MGLNGVGIEGGSRVGADARVCVCVCAGGGGGKYKSQKQFLWIAYMETNELKGSKENITPAGRYLFILFSRTKS